MRQLRDSHRTRRGFSRRDLIIVTLVVFVSLVLGLPALQQARESARKQQCKDNLRQIGLALHSYGSFATQFPPGWIGVTDGRPDPEGSHGWSWMAALLPWMGSSADSLHKSIDFTVPLTAASQAGARTTTVPAYLCPASTLPPSWTMATPDGEYQLASNSYVGLFGTESFKKCYKSSQKNCFSDGAFGQNRGRNFREFRDGMSQTLIVGERKPWSSQTGLQYSTWTGVIPRGNTPLERILGTGEYDLENQTALSTFSSPHPGGVHFILADGSVRMISIKVNSATYRTVVTVAGGDGQSCSF